MPPREAQCMQLSTTRVLAPHVAKRPIVKQRKRLRSALMPPAQTDFGPHFDFPPASLNNGPTQAPYPGW
jgi:hypothetical protein